jgi:hypothetical protein
LQLSQVALASSSYVLTHPQSCVEARRAEAYAVPGRSNPDRVACQRLDTHTVSDLGDILVSLTADTYTHVLSDGRELDYEGVLR